MKTEREKALEEIVEQLVPAVRDVMWCALVWNDHNFSERDLLDKAARAAKSLGFERGTLGSAVGPVNEWLAKIDAALNMPTAAAQNNLEVTRP